MSFFFVNCIIYKSSLCSFREFRNKIKITKNFEIQEYFLFLKDYKILNHSFLKDRKSVV